ncbi:MAG: 3-deoxy-D-manno-octulosonic acid transferase [Alphaproteobacteria bacterium]|nr:3-deoxy-D-manno-octulosonic acid transferase [Alphaproteobacteria bacterium]
MTTPLKLYRWATGRSEKLLQKLLQKRLEQGKEDPDRLWERMGQSKLPRPEGPLVWIHAASVGEAQSALILIDNILKSRPDCHILLTSGTRTSAESIGKKLPPRAFHQYIPLDHPAWGARFLDHWQPDLALWMESELWPNLILALQERGIKAALVNARLSDKSYKRWKWLPKTALCLLEPFSAALTQTATDYSRYRELGVRWALVTDNLKYSASPLPADNKTLQILAAKTEGRKVWVYASTHAGEEEMACRLHAILKNNWPDLLTIIVPRHPERGTEIEALCQAQGLRTQRRSLDPQSAPEHDTDIYIADTLGELGLFYRLAPIACIGRSFSDDGGGGHNPLEAAQLGCAVLHGPHVQFQKDIYEEMKKADAALELSDERHFRRVLQDLFSQPEYLAHMQKRPEPLPPRKPGLSGVSWRPCSPFWRNCPHDL